MLLTTPEWLARVLARPLGDPLDWDDYRLTMGEPTWSAVWAEIQASQAYDDGLDLGLRLLQATRQHRGRLTPRAYTTSQIRLYRCLLSMLEKAGRWDAYLCAWEAIRARADLWVSVKGDPTADNPRLAAFVRHPGGAMRTGPSGWGAARPARIELHFLYTLVARKAIVARRRAQEQARPSSLSAPLGPAALTIEEIQRRLLQIGEPAPGGPAERGGAPWERRESPGAIAAPMPAAAVDHTHPRRSREL